MTDQEEQETEVWEGDELILFLWRENEAFPVRVHVDAALERLLDVVDDLEDEYGKSSGESMPPSGSSSRQPVSGHEDLRFFVWQETGGESALVATAAREAPTPLVECCSAGGQAGERVCALCPARRLLH